MTCTPEVERVARALCENAVRKFANKPTGYNERVKALVDERWQDHADAARAAIEAMRSIDPEYIGVQSVVEALEEADLALQQFRGIIPGNGWDAEIKQAAEAQATIAAALKTVGGSPNER